MGSQGWLLVWRDDEGFLAALEQFVEHVDPIKSSFLQFDDVLSLEISIQTISSRTPVIASSRSSRLA